jgi:RNA polymerase sigma-70 factor (ECF subfamily)
MPTQSSAALAEQPRDRVVDPVVRRALDGDRDAEREVCSRLLPAIRSFARRRLRPASAEDFAQEALLLLVESMREGRVCEPERLASFALGICRNLAREGARVDERRGALFAKYGLTEADLVEEQAPLDVHRSHLEDCFSQLTERARKIIRATFCDDDSDAEIATALGVSNSNVRVIRHRSLAALRTCLERPISWVQQ